MGLDTGAEGLQRLPIYRGRSGLKKKPFDIILFFAVVMLLAIGLVMVLSASAVIAEHDFGDTFYYVKRQAIFAVLGIALMIMASEIDYWLYREHVRVIFLSALLSLMIVLIPGIGVIRGGARSWIGIGAFSIQPAEFAKLALIVTLAVYLERHHERLGSFWRGLFPPLLLGVFFFALIMLQPDLGTGTVLLGTTVFMTFVAGARLLHLFLLGGVGLVAFAGLVAAAPYRLQRILAYLDPWQDPLGAGYQTIQSLYAIGPGGLFGLGLGMSRQKYQYLPEPYNDFIFAITAEELGLIGATFVLLLFGVIIWRGYLIALYAPDHFARLTAVGITSMILIQVLINVGVVIGLLPVTGITLPLMSAGGSSLLIILYGLGVLLNISRYQERI
ncbi:MAG: stage V sporulation protein E [Candidatus Carbobacillus altaicus]|uniref:Cell division protein FtsW / Stage V sporulation protein E n=1 Tax=Candidatus Carbonibacillus altaicus TaxID=2163959 RepID=A0A2R6Y345_9BACL|nr:stage V sporulation protein E [Candidatus Carbobacillus altaicus]PTQ57104.1 MAG: Cell division protein FtsW / Stage V sporulation protein E [Candidatus Carbobacillus altaicus]